MANDVLQNGPDDLASLWNDETQLDILARQAVQDALQEHKRRGESVVVWQDGRIVTLAPDEIPAVPSSEETL